MYFVNGHYSSYLITKSIQYSWNQDWYDLKNRQISKLNYKIYTLIHIPGKLCDLSGLKNPPKQTDIIIHVGQIFYPKKKVQ